MQIKASKTDIRDKATAFLMQYYEEQCLSGLELRLSEVEQAISDTGKYVHTFEELEFGARVAWRNSNRCIGRQFWKTLKVRDKRQLSNPHEIFQDLQEHVNFAFNGGKIRSAISIYKPAEPEDREPIRIWNPQLFRYAAFRQKDGSLIGDPAMLEFTDFCVQNGWNGSESAFTFLPAVISDTAGKPHLFSWQGDIPEIRLSHPDHRWFEELGLRWYAIPLIANMVLEIGGINYTAAPFNGWYMLSEIAVRNLGDEKRYDLLPLIAEKMELPRDTKFQLWKDKALIVLNEAVWYSFDQAGVTLVDHHNAARQFLKFAEREETEGREVTGDWSWLIPPTASSATEVFHRDWPNTVNTPNYFYSRFQMGDMKADRDISIADCPFFSKEY